MVHLCHGDLMRAEERTHFSISFLAFLLSRSIFVMMLICGISREIMALRAAKMPEIN